MIINYNYKNNYEKKTKIVINDKFMYNIIIT